MCCSNKAVDVIEPESKNKANKNKNNKESEEIDNEINNEINNNINNSQNNNSPMLSNNENENGNGNYENQEDDNEMQDYSFYNLKELLEKGDMAISLEKYKEAAKIFQTMIQKFPDDVLGYMNIPTLLICIINQCC